MRPFSETLSEEEMLAYFWRRVDRSGECWIWTAGRNSHGYGRMHWRGRGDCYTHRLSWEIHNGPIPAGEWVLHTCDNPPCCNPAHLWLGSLADNHRDMVTKSRHHHGERHANAKLTDAQVEAIRRFFPGSGLTQAEMAAMLGVGRSSISRILSGRRRRSAPGGDAHAHKEANSF